MTLSIVVAQHVRKVEMVNQKKIPIFVRIYGSRGFKQSTLGFS